MFPVIDAEGESIYLRISGLSLYLTGTEAHGNLNINFSPEGGDLDTANTMRDYEIENLALEIDGRRFDFRDAHRGLNRNRTWNGSGVLGDPPDVPADPASKGTYSPDLAWTDGQTVRVRILDTRLSAQGQQEAAPFTAEFQGLPPAHDGETPFAFRIAFSEDVAIGYEDMRDHALEVTGATVTGARRVDGSNALWELTVQPEGTGEITLRAPHDRACDEEGALCTADGRSLAAAPAALILGPPPGGTQQAPLTAAFADAPGEHDGQTPFELRLTLSKEVAIGYATLRDHGFQVTGGTVTGARRTEPGSNAGWWITVQPDTDGAVTVTLPARACTETGAVCTAEDEALAAPATATVPGPDALPPLTASFASVPAEHDGQTPFNLRLSFSTAIGISYATLRDTAVTAAGGTVTGARRVDGRSDLWELTVEPSRTDAVTVTLAATAACGEPGAVCTADGRALSNAPTATVQGPPGLSVADAEVDEGPNAALAFAVTLDRAASSTVTVAYATADGTATEGQDYTEASGTLTFLTGETEKTVSVPVLDDSHDEGSETLTLTLSNPSGAYLADGEATGTIRNSDHMPQAWLARFGRTVAEQVIEAVESRIAASPPAGMQVTLAGQRIGAAASDEELREAEAKARAKDLAKWLKDGAETQDTRARSRAVAPRELLTGSAFSLTTEADGIGGGMVSLWGRGSVSRFDGREGELSLSGEVTGALVGADWTRQDWTAGLMMSHARGTGSYRGDPGSASGTGGKGEVESTVTGLYPYGRYRLTGRVTAWGAAGYGAGTLTLTPDEAEPIETDMDLMMAAAGLRGTVIQAPADGGPELAIKTDAMAVRTTSDAVRGSGNGGAGNLADATGDTTRLRLGLEGTWRGLTVGEGTLSPMAEIGMRHDGGDAETGFGLDLGVGLAWADPQSGITAELRGRGLLTHESEGFRDRGISGSFAWDPGQGSDRGPKVTLTQSMGASATGGVDTLLGHRHLGGLAANDDGDELQRRRLELKLGYGYSVLEDRFTMTPEFGMGISNGHRDYTLGWRLVRRTGDWGSAELSFEARRSEGADSAPEHGVGLTFISRF